MVEVYSTLFQCWSGATLGASLAAVFGRHPLLCAARADQVIIWRNWNLSRFVSCRRRARQRGAATCTFLEPLFGVLLISPGLTAALSLCFHSRQVVLAEWRGEGVSTLCRAPRKTPWCRFFICSVAKWWSVALRVGRPAGSHQRLPARRSIEGWTRSARKNS